jgi:hypothetical protein
MAHPGNQILIDLGHAPVPFHDSRDVTEDAAGLGTGGVDHIGELVGLAQSFE